MAFAGSPEIPDLLLPVSEAEATQVRQANQQWLDEYLKRAKRHRLVRVDAGALLSREQVRITLFDGHSLVLQVSERELHGSDTEPYSFDWTGQVPDPPFTAEDLLAMNPNIRSLEAAKFLYDAWLANAFSGSLYLKDATTGGTWPVPHNHVGDDCGSEPPASIPGATPFYAVRGDFSDPRYPGAYRLRPIEQDPEYHVLIELDPGYSANITMD